MTTPGDYWMTADSQQAGNPGIGLLGAIRPATDQLGRNGEAALAADGHAIESQDNPPLVKTEQAGLAQAIMDKGIAAYAPIGEQGALVGEGAIAGIVNDDIGRDLSSEGSKGTSANLEVFNLEELALQPFMVLPDMIGG
jgi:hypothetical protein